MKKMEKGKESIDINCDECIYYNWAEYYPPCNRCNDADLKIVGERINFNERCNVCETKDCIGCKNYSNWDQVKEYWVIT